MEWIKWLKEGFISTHLDVINTNIDSFWARIYDQDHRRSGARAPGYKKREKGDFLFPV
jgi:hypothetical protein